MKIHQLIVTLFLASSLMTCSIIEDSDVQSEQELAEKLKLDQIIFTQSGDGTTYDADAVTMRARASYNSSNQMARLDWSEGIIINNPNIPETLIRFNYSSNGITNENLPDAISTNIVYNSNGQPSKLTQVDETNKHEFESFEFTYNNDGRLATMIAVRKSIDGTINQMTSDALTYQNEKVSSVARTLTNLNNMSEVSQTIEVTRGSSGLISEVNYTFSSTLTRSFEQFNSENDDSYFYFSQTKVNGTDDDPWGNPQVKISSQGILQSLELTDQRTGANGETFGEDRNTDVFFVHPLLMLADLFVDGGEIAQVFIDDWWEAGEIDEANFTNFDRAAFVNYEYTAK